MARNARLLVGVGTLVALGTIAGCNPPATTTDSGPREDTGPAVTGTVIATDPVTGMAVPADLSCLGSVTIPAGGTPLSGTLQFQEFISHADLTSNMIDVFSDNTLTPTCDPPNCTTYSTDANGIISPTIPAGAWFAFRVYESGQTAQVSAFNQPWISTAGETLAVVPVFAPSTISLVGDLIGRTYDPSRFGSMSGRAVDCAGRALSRVRVRVFIDGSEVITGPLGDRSAATVTGLEGTAPTRTGLTGASGNFVGANIIPSTDCRVETWGVLTDGAAQELIGCSEASVQRGEITITLVGPLRSDYPAGSGCAAAAAARP